jgi:hypothetical protein
MSVPNKAISFKTFQLGGALVFCVAAAFLKLNGKLNSELLVTVLLRDSRDYCILILSLVCLTLLKKQTAKAKLELNDNVDDS